MHRTKTWNLSTLQNIPRADGMITAVEISIDIDSQRGLKIGSSSIKL